MRVQRSAWGIDGRSGIVPAHVMIAAQHHGGLVLGAYHRSQMVGILYGFTSIERGVVYHYSHITGVERGYQSKGVGYRLKLAQREHVLRRRQKLVRWTYDPLQASNAYFNIGKLGAICRTYRRNLYGSLNDSLNKGRVTDRFEVEWFLMSLRVQDRLRGRHTAPTLDTVVGNGGEFANKTTRTRRGWRSPRGIRLGLKSRRILVEVPESIVKVKNSSLRAANSWTEKARKTFEHYFHRGYVAVDVLVEREPGERRIFYLLEPYSSTLAG